MTTSPIIEGILEVRRQRRATIALGQVECLGRHFTVGLVAGEHCPWCKAQV